MEMFQIWTLTTVWSGGEVKRTVIRCFGFKENTNQYFLSDSIFSLRVYTGTIYP